MMRKKQILSFLLAFLLSFDVCAKKDAVNIFDFPREMPKREILSETGAKVKISDFKGDFILLVIWSRHCTPCVKELDDLNGFVKKTRNDGIRVMMLSPDEEWASLSEERRFLNKFQAPDLEFYNDIDGKLAEDLGVFTSPHTVLVNKKGEEIGRIRGAANWNSDEVIEYIYKIKAQHG